MPSDRQSVATSRRLSSSPRASTRLALLRWQQAGHDLDVMLLEGVGERCTHGLGGRDVAAEDDRREAAFEQVAEDCLEERELGIARRAGCERIDLRDQRRETRIIDRGAGFQVVLDHLFVVEGAGGDELGLLVVDVQRGARAQRPCRGRGARADADASARRAPEGEAATLLTLLSFHHLGTVVEHTAVKSARSRPTGGSCARQSRTWGNRPGSCQSSMSRRRRWMK